MMSTLAMPLETGTKLGPYEILGQLGAGGMGEVYKATDTRLNRTVAVKVLPAHFSDDREMKQRFDREAKTIASLNHPHICTLHDIGTAQLAEAEGATQSVDFIVMEYLEGESLAERLARGPLPLEEALKIAIEIADGLEKAHAHGVTHRDLKPGNVMLTPGGAKLLDFGLAKLQQGPQTPGSDTATEASSATTPGTILGTMQYMAPEQLEGREADARTDIFAFGAVLYEMVTGRKAFEGKSKAHLIAAIVSTNPEPISTVEPSAPRVLDFLVGRCLEKDPDDRLQTATDLVWELRWIAEGGAEGGLPVLSAQRRRLVRAAPMALVGVAVMVAALAVLAFIAPGGADADDVTRFVIDVPDMPVAEAVSISPDGRTVAYSARDGGTTAVYVRPMLIDIPQRLAGTEGAERLFWSPDSQSIAFFAGGQLKRVEAIGGDPQNIANTPDLLGGSWNAEGEIIFGSSAGLQRVLAAGGEPETVPVSIGESTGLPQEPYFLPDGRSFLFLVGPAPNAAQEGAGFPQDGGIYAGSLDSPDVIRLNDAQSNPVYAEPGYLLYHREGALFAQPFDAGAWSLEGEPVRLADGLPWGATGAGAFAASRSGVLLYRNDPILQPQVTDTGGPAASSGIGAEPPLSWVNRQGQGEVASEPRRWIGVDLAPDGRRAAVHRHDPEGGDVWIFEDGVLTPTRFTFDGTQDNAMPIWSPDGTQIAFGSRRDGMWGLYIKAANGTRDEELVIESDIPKMPMCWSPDNDLVYWVNDPETRGDIWRVQAEPAANGEPEAVPFLQTRFDERNPEVSPDGRWIAYSSNQTGRSEVYVQPFPEGQARIQVSVNGGVFPRWRADSRELYFMNLVSLGGMMASEITVEGATIRREVPRKLFQTYFISQPHGGGAHHAYAVSGDGGRFLMPQFAVIGAAFGLGGGRGGIGAAVSATFAGVVNDRNAGTGGGSTSTGPITVVLDWSAATGP
jgi:Tol biopolymer transport system component